MFPAGWFLINGWLFHNHTWPQWLHVCLTLMKVSICWATSPVQSWWHDLQAVNKLNRWDLNTRNLTSFWGGRSSVLSLWHQQGNNGYWFSIATISLLCVVVFLFWTKWCVQISFLWFSFSRKRIIKWYTCLWKHFQWWHIQKIALCCNTVLFCMADVCLCFYVYCAVKFYNYAAIFYLCPCLSCVQIQTQTSS